MMLNGFTFSDDGSIAIGPDALNGQATGQDNTAIGRSANGNSGPSTLWNTAVGATALEGSTVGYNSALGHGAGKAITTGTSNVFVGFSSGAGGAQNPAAIASIAIGYRAVTTKSGQAVFGSADITETVLRGEIVEGDEGVRLSRMWPSEYNYFLHGAGPAAEPAEGDQGFGPAVGNVGVGPFALMSVTQGITNTAMGFEALKSCTIGVDHTAFGSQALRAQISGVGSTAMGKLALANSTTGGNNTAIGDTALEFTNGNANCALGYSAGIKSTGDNNCLFGVFAGGHASGKVGPDCPFDRCNAFGAATMQLNLSGNKNNLFGTYAGHVLTGDENCGFGDESLRLLTTGARNACFGNDSGWRLTTGTDNVFVGTGAGRDGSQKADAVGTTVVGAGAVSTRDNEVVIGKSTDTHVTLAGVMFTKVQMEALLALVA